MATITFEDRATHLRDVGRIERLRARKRRLELRIALRLERIDRVGSFVLDGCASLGEFGEKKGFCAGEARILAAVGEAVKAAPGMVKALLDGKSCPEKVATVGRVLKDPGLSRPDEDWGSLITTLTSKQLRTEVKRRQAERKHGLALPLNVFLSPQGALDFQRCRQLTIQKTQKILTEGETLEVVCADYVDRYDPERKALRALAKGAVAEATGPAKVATPGGDRSRFTPAAEKHALVLRQEDRCAFEGCDEPLLEDGHIRPYRSGGSNGARNKRRYCRKHHDLLDCRTLKVVGREGREVVVDINGTVVGHLRGPPPAG
jgi:hypothetical protein